MNTLVEFLVNFYDALAAVLFVTFFCKISIKKLYFSVPAVVLIFTVSNVFLFIDTFSVLLSVIITAMLYVYCFLCKPKDKIRLVLAPIIFELTLIFVNTVFLTVFSSLFNTDMNILIMTGELPRYLWLIVTKIIITAILLLVLKFTSFTDRFSPFNLILYLISPIFSVYVMYVFMKIGLSVDLSQYTGIIVTAVILLALSNIFTIILFEISNKNAEGQRGYMLLQNQIQSERENYQEMIKASENFHKLKHDIKNHLLYIHKIIDNNETDKASKYINSIAKDLQDTEKYMVTGNRTLDYILSSKITENREITFICTGNCLDALDHIDELDIAVLFGNMLDNAIDAVKSIADKTVEIRFSRFNDFFNIHISNPIEESVLKSNPNLLTSKKGEGHGWGLKSVQSIVEKYSGLFDCYEQNNKFTVHISFSKPV